MDGFGNRNPGGRRKGMRPRWDALHPGRKWAEECEDRSETPEMIKREIEEKLAEYSVPIA